MDRTFITVIVLLLISVVLYTIFVAFPYLDKKIENCNGLVVKTPNGWECSTAQKG